MSRHIKATASETRNRENSNIFHGRWVAWKKVVFAVLCLLVLTRMFYIVFRGEVSRQYVIASEVDTADAAFVPCVGISQDFVFPEKVLNSVELIFNGVEEQSPGAVVMTIEGTGGLLYQTNISLNTIKNMEWKRVYVNLPVDPSEKHTICLDATDDCPSHPEVLLAKMGSQEASASFCSGKILDGQVAIRYGFLASPRYMDILLALFFWAVLLAGVCLILNHWEEIQLYFSDPVGVIAARIRVGG